jgi:lambda family phage portal protein
MMTSADEEIWQSLRTLRARSRALARDDDYFKNYLRKLKNNVVGHCGMTMKVEAQLEYDPNAGTAHGNSLSSKDRKLNRTVEAAWSIWCKKTYASVSTKLSFNDLERLCIESVAVDGEAIFRKIVGRNVFGFSLQQIDPDWLDENYNEKLPNGNRVVMSVEMDKYDRPLFYHFTPPRHSYYGVVRDFGIAPEGKRIPVPADEIIHCFLNHRPGQTRGVPMAHTVIGRIRDLDRYEEAEVVNATVSASKMGFISPDVDSPSETGADIGSNGENAKKETPILDKVEPGIIQKLPAGWTFEAFDPKAPTTVFAAFCKQILRGIAAGLGISYNLLTGDLEGVNYSSLRSAALDERDEWKALQHWMINHFYEPVYEAWLLYSVGSPYLRISESDVIKVIDVAFKPRGWAWVDPQKDAEANATELEAGTATYTEVLAEKGVDFEAHMERIKYERDLIKALGLEFSYGTKQQQQGQDGKNNAGAGAKGKSGGNSNSASQ